MTLPPSYESAENYFIEALTFFDSCKLLYDFPNTKILTNRILNNICVDSNNLNLKIFDNNLKLTDLRDNNREIKQIVEQIEKLSPEYVMKNCDGKNQEVIEAPLSIKKKHEIIYLADEINNVCRTVEECDTIVDFGSGLGYLDQFLFQKYAYNVLGIECNSQHYVGAKTRQRKYHENSLEKVKYVVHKIDEKSNVFIKNCLQEKFGGKDFCIAGLHACADLTIDGLNLFLNMPEAKALILMSCCYHKMYKESDKFKNFPLSKTLKDICEVRGNIDFFNVPFLRLAAQPPSSGENLQDVVFNLLARAVLESYANERNYKIKRKKRKAVNMKTIERNFAEYAKIAQDSFTLTCKDSDCSAAGVMDACQCSLPFDLKKLNEIWRETETLQIKAAIFVLLQRLLQPVFENYILYDRIMYLKENGVFNCRVEKIVNDIISPRCLAIIARKS